jgi:hypothetical protein
MNVPNRRSPRSYRAPFATVGFFVMLLAGCVPLETVQKPTLDEVRLGNVRGQIAEDASLRPGEIRAEVVEVDRGRREIRVQTDSGRRQVVAYDIDRTRVIYHGWDYTVDHIVAGDVIAYRQLARDRGFVETIRIQEPVQARTTTGAASRSPPRAGNDVVEGTVERIDPRLGVFDIRPRSGRTVTVSVPYNARTADVDYFRSLRRGDHVRVEGEFVNPDNLQLLSFVSSRDR